MKIVLQCQKCFAVSIDDWAEIDESGRLSLGRWAGDTSAGKHWELPYCHNCKSDELIVGVAVLSGMTIP